MFRVPRFVTTCSLSSGDAAVSRTCVMNCPSSVSTGQLHPSRGFHVRPINHVFCMGTTAPEGAWNPYLGAGFRLDAFSGYPFRT